MAATLDIVELARDAARYRWLRDKADPSFVERIWSCHEPELREQLIDKEMNSEYADK